MDPTIALLGISAVTIAFLHTICGPDHYVPFVAMARAGKWSLRKTIWVTLLAGIGHVGSSVLLGSIGITLGLMVSRLEGIEASRGAIAGWLLTAFGLGYMIWGIYYSLNHKMPMSHVHIHPDFTGAHSHDHDASDDHLSGSNRETVQSNSSQTAKLTPWILFTIFIFGPCEPLIPLLMYPAAESSWAGVIFVTTLFSVTTVVTMLGTVLILLRGAEVIQFPALQRYSHAVAGMLMMFCGVAISVGL